jgi:hypothetical protein
MTAFDEVSNSPALVEVAEQNQTTPVLPSGSFQRSSLPKPNGTSASVADSGRIRFGAGFRLPTSK